VAEAAYLAVARLHKPHGLKGEALVWVLTDEPDRVLAQGKTLVPVDEHGRATGAGLVIERSRAYHREWLLKFAGVHERTPLEEWKDRLFGVPVEELSPPGPDQMYEHEIPGASVLVRGAVVGEALGLVPVPGGRLLAVDVDGREVLVPFRRPIVVGVDRGRRAIELDPPDGLFEL
jgi:16S rRNA processing protein RimM